MDLENILKKIIAEEDKVEDVLEIILDGRYMKNCLCEADKKLLEKYSSTRIFGMNACKLTSLNNFPEFIELEILELSDNNFLSGEELKNLPNYENLTELRLANTKVESFDNISDLKKYKKLHFLELDECPISKKENYRNKVFEILPNLIYLDSTTINGDVYKNESEEEENEQEEGEDEEEDDFISDLEGEEFEDEDFDEEDEEEGEMEEQKGDKKVSHIGKRDRENEEDDEHYKPQKKRKLD